MQVWPNCKKCLAADDDSDDDVNVNDCDDDDDSDDDECGKNSQSADFFPCNEFEAHLKITS